MGAKKPREKLNIAPPDDFDAIDSLECIEIIAENNARASIYFSVMAKVEEFIDAFGVGEGLTPEETVDLWKSLVDEELTEVYSATSAENLAKEVADLFYVYSGLVIASRKAGVPVDAPQKAVAILRHWTTVFGLMVEVMVDVVHKSNMTKLGEDGKPIRREDGKILKGPNYKPADMSVFAPIIKQVIDIGGEWHSGARGAGGVAQ